VNFRASQYVCLKVFFRCIINAKAKQPNSTIGSLAFTN